MLLPKTVTPALTLWPPPLTAAVIDELKAPSSRFLFSVNSIPRSRSSISELIILTSSAIAFSSKPAQKAAVRSFVSLSATSPR